MTHPGESSSAARRWLPRAGAVLGEYRLERLLGRGGMAAVYVGRHVQLGVERAIKVQLLGARADREERFAREARSLARLEPHPGVVQIHSFAVDGAVAYMALDLVAGSDLERALAGGPMEVGRALRIARGVAGALAHVHRAGIVHRDLKPANVLLRADDAPVLTDFGVARDEAEARMTASHAVVGTPFYMAPEQLVRQPGGVGPPADVFALGVVLYELLTGRRPFDGDGLVGLSRAIVSADPTAPSRLRPGLSPDVDRVVLAALAKAPAERPATDELARALDALLRGAPVRLARAPARRPGRGRALALAAATLALGTAAVAIALTAPARAARRTLAEHLAWEADTLEPWGLGLAPVGSSAAPAAAELGRRRAALEGASAAADVATRPDLQRALARLRAHERLLAGQPPGGAAAGACLEDHVVDALALLRRGDAEAAQERLTRASGFLPAEALRRRIEAEVDPRGLLLRRPPDAERLRAPDRAATAVALERLAGATSAAAPADLDAAARELARQVEAARLHDVTDLAAAGDAKREGLEGAAARLSQEVDRALARRAGPELAARAVRFLVAEPAIRPGPAAAAALARLYEEPFAAFLRAGAGERAWEHLVLGLRAEATLAYGLGAAAASEVPASLVRAARAVIAFDGLEAAHPDGVTLLAVASLRAGVLRPARDLLRRADAAGLERFLAAWPESRAARLALTFGALSRDATRPERTTPEVYDELEATLAHGVPDVAPAYEAEVRLFVVGGRIEHVVGKAPGRRALDAAQARALRDLVEELRRARAAALPFDFLLLDAAEAEARALLALDDAEGAARVWRATMERFQARSLDPGGADVPMFQASEDKAQGQCARVLAGLLTTLGRPREAEEVLRAAVAHHRQIGGSQPGETRGALAALLRAQGRVEEALAALDPIAQSVEESLPASVEAVEALRALGRVDEARALLELARRRHPRSAELARLADLLPR